MLVFVLILMAVFMSCSCPCSCAWPSTTPASNCPSPVFSAAVFSGAVSSVTVSFVSVSFVPALSVEFNSVPSTRSVSPRHLPRNRRRPSSTLRVLFAKGQTAAPTRSGSFWCNTSSSTDGSEGHGFMHFRDCNGSEGHGVTGCGITPPCLRARLQPCRRARSFFKIALA